MPLGLSTEQGRALQTAARGCSPTWMSVAAGLGFGIDQVALSGHKFTFDRDVFDVLDLANARSYASFDAKAAKDRIERLPWVSDRRADTRLSGPARHPRSRAGSVRGLGSRRADLSHRYYGPGSVRGERGLAAEPAALLRVKALPPKPENFLALINRYPSIHRRFEAAIRVGERRWTLKLAGGVTLELPADGEAQVLESMTQDAALVRVVERGNATLDFRAPGRIAVRKTADPATQEPKPEPRS